MKAILSIIMCILLFGCASTQQIRSQEAISGPLIEEKGLFSLFFDGERGITWLSIKNTYLLQFLPDCQYELPPEDFTKDDFFVIETIKISRQRLGGAGKRAFIVHPNDEYRIKGHLGKKLSTVMGNIPIIQVTYIERIK